MDKLWYAVMRDCDDTDWGTGSFDLEEAKAMLLRDYPDTGYIAVIDANYDDNGNATTDGICVDEIWPEDFDGEEETVCRIEYHQLRALGATEEQLRIYSNCDPLTIQQDGRGLYHVSGIVDACGLTGAELLELLDELGGEDDE